MADLYSFWYCCSHLSLFKHYIAYFAYTKASVCFPCLDRFAQILSIVVAKLTASTLRASSSCSTYSKYCRATLPRLSFLYRQPRLFRVKQDKLYLVCSSRDLAWEESKSVSASLSNLNDSSCVGRTTLTLVERSLMKQSFNQASLYRANCWSYSLVVWNLDKVWNRLCWRRSRVCERP